MNSNPAWQSNLAASFGELRVTRKPPTGLIREKAKPLLLKTETRQKPVPHPPTSPKKSPQNGDNIPLNIPTPPSVPKTKSTFQRKFYKTEEVLSEDRICGDGESCKDDEYVEKDVIPERQPGDGCFSDIAEEDEDEIDESDNEDDVEGDNNFEDEYYECDEIADEEELGEYFDLVLMYIIGNYF